MGKEDDNAKVVINIGTAYNVNPQASVVNNTFNIGTGEEGGRVIAEALGIRTGRGFKRKEQEGVRDLVAVKETVMRYVNQESVRKLLKDEVKQGYERMWRDILDLPEVEAELCHIGKQQKTDFNRFLIGSIFAYLRHREIYKVVYRDGINRAALIEALEGDKDHTIKHAFQEDPPKAVREAIDRYFEKKDSITML